MWESVQTHLLLHFFLFFLLCGLQSQDNKTLGTLRKQLLSYKVKQDKASPGLQILPDSQAILLYGPSLKTVSKRNLFKYSFTEKGMQWILGNKSGLS